MSRLLFGRPPQDAFQDPAWAKMRVHAIAVRAQPVSSLPEQWCGGVPSFAEHWRIQNYELDLQMLNGAPSLSGLIKSMEEAHGYLTLWIRADARPNNEPIYSAFDGFQGFAQGMINEVATVGMVYIFRP